MSTQLDPATHSIQTLGLTGGVDWLTMTVKSQPRRAELFRRFQRIHAPQAAAKKFSWHGYVGLQLPGARWGARQDSDILILSGPLANTYFKFFSRLAENITRLDLAVTAMIFPPIPRLTSTYYENLDFQERKWTELRNRAGGNTLYVGSRASDQMGRVYDKGVESNLSAITGALWRYEIEYKTERARAVWAALLVDYCPRRGPTPTITRHVFDWFDTRNVPPVWDRRKDGQVIEAHLRATETDEDRTLAWFRTQVSPSVRKLVGHRRGEVIEALGLAEADPALYAPSI
jgi:hypothetical protein